MFSKMASAVNASTQGFCRDCLARQGGGQPRCERCGSPRLVRHDELYDLSIAHIDCDAFYAAIEKRDRPELRDRPLIVGGGKRGVVSTACYIARIRGVRSAMPMFKALEACPDAVVVKPDMEKYVGVGRQVRAMMQALTPLVEPVSIDEAFLDLSGTQRLHGMPPALVLARFAKDVENAIGISVSAGLSYCKFLAKVASDLEKPDGLVLFPLEAVPTRLWPMPVERLWGVGPKTAERLRGHGLATVADLVNAAEGRLARIIGEGSAEHLLALAHGRDDRPVEGGREAKSISEERTYGENLTRPGDVDKALLARADGVARELRHQGLVARTVHIKVRTGDFETVTRAKTLAEPTDLAEVVLAAARELFRERIELKGRGVRLLGVGVSGLEPPGSGQAALFANERQEKLRSLARTADELREKFGKAALSRARLMPSPSASEEGDDDALPEASSLPTVD